MSIRGISKELKIATGTVVKLAKPEAWSYRGAAAPLDLRSSNS
jgi:hypothetical protein